MIGKQSGTRRTIIGLLGISFVVLIHELGHFFACLFFGVPTPVFSIGFGPALISTHIGTTLFQIAVLPLGGYVSIDPTALAAQPYLHKALILLAGIIMNFAFTLSVFAYFKHKKITVTIPTPMRNGQEPAPAIIGPFGIISLIGRSFQLGTHAFVYILAIISANIAFLNLLPIPMLDGGHLALYTIQAVAGPLNPKTLNLITMIVFGLLMLFFIFVTLNDAARMKRR